MSRLIQFALLGILCFVTALPAHALGNIVSLEIVDRSNNATLTTWRQRGQHYVAGQPGIRYAVRMNNRSAERVLVVLSVDGINVITGATASPAQSGYVLEPHGSAEITGWRKNMNETAAFYFTSLADSYAARTDRPDNTGVIGLAIFSEKPQYRMEAPAPSLSAESAYAKSGAPMRERAASQADKALGTGHGEREYAPTEYTGFERARSQPDEIVRLRYDSRSRLIAAGIIPGPRPTPDYTPNPFPGFVPDPAH